MNEILISHHSTAIEGSSLTLEESRLFLSEGIVAKGKPFEEYNMVKDHYEALKWVIEKAGQARQAGQIDSVFVGERYFMSYQKIEREVKKLTEKLSKVDMLTLL